ncbi:NAD(P)-dependent oxidoreductase [Antarcticimicrobium sediminis]|uniref:NAD(P)-dependent oxidoreductase n=1 Tax=Antarcticimicrobium sediminis TaxID=2546227 RepID=A0A4R5EUQ3_9RHOB|nr:NAD(P)-dependent oxidoreductase [Antarcticimicrobium sediminis]TDE38447.1 NAD(P)-dependent oxidoreductase [Antarcticimicrobium sediminis]
MNKPRLGYRLGYLGTGLMGGPMVLNLLKAGYEVTVWNRTASKCDAAVAAGARRADSPADLARQSDVVMACLTNAAAVEAVLFGANGIAEVAGPQLFVDFSSMDPEQTKGFADRLRAANGMGWVDAPVSGGTPAATAGALTIMAGGAKADFALAEPVMAPLAQRVTHMGPVGSGQMTKLVNQIISGCTMAVVAEAVQFAKTKGVDATRLTEALAGGFADSKPFQLLAPRMAAKTFENPLGTVAMMLKDLDTVAQVGDDNSALPMTETARALMRAACDQGHAQDDISTIILALKGRT